MRMIATFWSVMKKFSPYVEKGNPPRVAYASEMPYDTVSRF